MPKSTDHNKNSPLRFGIIGCGRIAQRHAEHMVKFGSLVAICDPKVERLEPFIKKFGGQGFSTPEEMFAVRPSLDVVTICTPNRLHAEHTILALRAGAHVLCEKPMATRVQDCERMILEAEKAGKKLFIVKQNRFNPPVAFVKSLLDRGQLGKVLSVELNCFWNRGDAYYANSDWKGKRELDGGALFTQFSHFIDLLYWFCGEMREVCAFVGNSHHPKIEIDDHGVAILKFESGTIGTLHYTTNAYQKNFEGSITLFCTKGTVKIGGEYLNVLEFLSGENLTIPNDLVPPLHGGARAYTASMSHHREVYQNLVGVIRGEESISTTGTEGKKCVEMIEKIYRAAGW